MRQAIHPHHERVHASDVAVENPDREGVADDGEGEIDQEHQIRHIVKRDRRSCPDR